MTCPICDRNVLSHASRLVCSICLQVYHMKCITLSPGEQVYFMSLVPSWYCQKCTCECLPFNHIEDNNLFSSAAQNLDGIDEWLQYFSDKVFRPILNTDFDRCSEMDDFDPDINVFNNIDHHVRTKCTYVSETMFSNEIKKCGLSLETNLLSVCHINIRSLKSNLSHFDYYLTNLKFNFALICVSETWLTEDNCNLYQLEDYRLVEQHRVNKTGGGVGIFVRKEICFSQRKNLQFQEDYIETIFIEIDKSVFSTKSNVLIGNVYRPPNSDIKQFLDKYGQIMEMVHRENKLCYILGDFNLDLLNFEHHIYS